MLRMKKRYRGRITRVVTQELSIVFEAYTKAEADVIVSNEANSADNHVFFETKENQREYDVEELDS